MMFCPIGGPTLGGYITEFYNWRLVFYMNLPIGLLAFIAILFAVPESERESGRPFDVFGFTMLSIALISLQLMLDRGERADRSEEHTSELESLMRISYAVFCLKKKNTANY